MRLTGDELKITCLFGMIRFAAVINKFPGGTDALLISVVQNFPKMHFSLKKSPFPALRHVLKFLT
jgi:hypothetical protein